MSDMEADCDIHGIQEHTTASDLKALKGIPLAILA
jgi:hypothetical protein